MNRYRSGYSSGSILEVDTFKEGVGLHPSSLPLRLLFSNSNLKGGFIL